MFMIIISIIFPFLSFLIRGRFVSALICIFLQYLLFGWPIAAIWAVSSLQNDKIDKLSKILEKYNED